MKNIKSIFCKSRVHESMPLQQENRLIKITKISIILCLILTGTACNKSFLDVVPDNVATIENAFANRNEAEKYLFTCYSYMPAHGNLDQDPSILGGDELMVPISLFGFDNIPNDQLAQGFQNVVNPYLNYWDGELNGKALFKGIRDCNIFLENIGNVPDIQEIERKRWIAEVTFLKAYYHFYLFRMYGPIPLIKENLPISSGINEVKVSRATVEETVNYIVELLDEAALDLPELILDQNSELGRITKPIDLSVKAMVLVTAASPLFNGNVDFSNLKNKDGKELFNTTFDATKWNKAVTACKDAVELCEKLGFKLNYYTPKLSSFNLSDQTLTEMSVRNAVTEKWNPEIIWGNTNSMANAIQYEAQAKIDPLRKSNFSYNSRLAPTLRMAELFYTKNGVPINEDKDWDYNNRYNLKTATVSDKYHIKDGYTTAYLHFDREERFYADLAFDGGAWYGQGKFDDNDMFYVEAKAGQLAGGFAGQRYSGTGYWPKKLVNFNNVIGESNYSVMQYPWPVIRLADIYLLYAEAINEQSGPTADAYKYINLVRKRADLPTVQNAWTNHAKPALANKYTTKEGFRSIIHQERLIEFAFEGQRYWDLRRWKEAPNVYNTSIKGWDISQETNEAYYRVKNLFTQPFQLKNYFWPIKEYDITVNNNLVQNSGW